jgi:hypothetical protein
MECGLQKNMCLGFTWWFIVVNDERARHFNVSPGIWSRELFSVLLAAHILGVNSTTEELTTACGPDPVPAPDFVIGVPHNGSSFLTPGNHERLLQAEARSRKALSNTPKDKRISGYERCKTMMIHRLQMRQTPHVQRNERLQDCPDPITLPNEAITAQDIRRRCHNAVLAPCSHLTNASDVSASHAVSSDDSLATKRDEGASSDRETIRADNLNQHASGGSRIHTTPDLPLDLTEEEKPMTLTYILETLLSRLIPDSPGPSGHLLRPIMTSERKLAHLICSDPGVHGQERAEEYMNNTRWYSGLTIDILATKLSR